MQYTLLSIFLLSDTFIKLHTYCYEISTKLFSVNSLDLEILTIKEILQILDLCRNLNRRNLQNLIVSLFIYIQLYYYLRTGSRILIKPTWTFEVQISFIPIAN
jgi:hypothetical protein